MQSLNTRVFKAVVGVHLALILFFMFQGCVTSCVRPKPEMFIPVEFVVDVSMPLPDMGMPEAQIPEPEVPVFPREQVAPPLPKKPDPPKEPPPRSRREIDVSRNRVVRKEAPFGNNRNTLTESEIRKLLEAGARPGDHTSILDEDQRGLALIKQTLDVIWQKPSSAVAGASDTHLKLWLEPDGTVRKTELSKKSGNPELDASVQEVGRQVRRIHGLSPDFIRRRSPVTVGFEVGT